MALKLRIHEMERVARAAGYESYRALLEDQYIQKSRSLQELSSIYNLNVERLKKHLTTFGIKVRKRGGPNNQQVVLTAELIAEIARDGVPVVALRLGIEQSRLYALMRKLVKDQQL